MPWYSDFTPCRLTKSILLALYFSVNCTGILSLVKVEIICTTSGWLIQFQAQVLNERTLHAEASQ
jgi:hypothetical protein